MGKIKKSGLSYIYDIGVLLVGSFLFAIAYNMFYTPGNVFTGGAGGLALAINKLTGFPTGISIILINVPLALLFVYFYGIKAGIKSILGMASTSIAIDIVGALNFLPSVFSNPKEYGMLYALFGGVALGLGVGILFTRGFSTGGSDYGAFLLRIKLKRIPTSKLILIIDMVVILIASIVTAGKDFIYPLFSSIINIVVESFVIEFVTNGNNRNKVAYIFTDYYAEVSDKIIENTPHSTTVFDGVGWYTKDMKKVIMVVVKKNEVYYLKKLVKSIDSKAFIVLCDATETIGEGFKETVYDTAAISPRQEKKQNQNNQKQKDEK